MKALNAITFRESHSHPDKLGENMERTADIEFALKVEDYVLENCPLPTTYDVGPIQGLDFSEVTYADVFGGLVLGAMNPEVTTRIVVGCLTEVEKVEDHSAHIRDVAFDKYKLVDPKHSYNKVIFLPGSNLYSSIDLMKLKETIWREPDVMVKPHPITVDKAIADIAQVVSWARIIPPEESGLGYLKWADKTWYMANSELGMLSACFDIPAYDFTSVEKVALMPYYPMYHSFEDGNPAHNREVMNRVLSDKRCGWIMPWMDDWKERCDQWFEIMMKVREFMYPITPPISKPCKDCQGK